MCHAVLHLPHGDGGCGGHCPSWRQPSHAGELHHHHQPGYGARCARGAAARTPDWQHDLLAGADGNTGEGVSATHLPAVFGKYHTSILATPARPHPAAQRPGILSVGSVAGACHRRIGKIARAQHREPMVSGRHGGSVVGSMPRAICLR